MVNFTFERSAGLRKVLLSCWTRFSLQVFTGLPSFVRFVYR